MEGGQARSGSGGSVPAMLSGAVRGPGRRSLGGPGLAGLVFLGLVALACLATLPWTLREVSEGEGKAGVPRYSAGQVREGRLPPWWWPATPEQARRFNAAVPEEWAAEAARKAGVSVEEARSATQSPAAEAMRERWARSWLGTDVLGRSLLVRCLLGGAISLGVGLAAAALSVCIGTLYGALAGWMGGRVDGVMMRIVDVLYGLPYVLLVVLLAVAADALVDRGERAAASRALEARVEFVERGLRASPDRADDPALREELEARALAEHGTGELGAGQRQAISLLTLLAAIGGVSWLTMARVVRGQVLSLKGRPFIEAARAVGASPGRIFARHLLPNLVGPIVVYATLTVPQAILQESFLSFLGIGVKPPLPSWGNLAADGLTQINPYESNWWLLVFPCVLLGATLLALNFVGEGLRERFDPARAGR